MNHAATPGPYRAYQSRGHWYIRSESMGGVIASVYVGAIGIPAPEMEATARTLAAAPVMLRALRRLADAGHVEARNALAAAFPMSEGRTQE